MAIGKGKQKQQSLYPYGPSIGTGEMTMSKGRAGMGSMKAGKSMSREVNRGTKKGGK